MFSDDEVLHIAKLARIGLTDDEVKKFSGQLDGILAYVQKLDLVDTSNVDPTSQVTGLRSVMRRDEVVQVCPPEELLQCSELPTMYGQIKVKPVIS